MKTAVLLVNLGTPSEPTRKGVRNFLTPFLSDRRVVNIPPMLWLPLLHCIVLPFRCGKVAKLYEEIWTPEGSPLLVITKQQVEALQKVLNERLSVRAAKEESGCSSHAVDPSNITTQIIVSYAMTYTEPSIEAEIRRLKVEEGCERIIVLPLYPQYSSTTTGPIYAQIGALFTKDVNVPDVRIVHDYYRRKDFNLAVANSISKHLKETRAVAAANGEAFHDPLLLFSYHGIPVACVERGDPYASHCYYNSKAVGDILGYAEDEDNRTDSNMNAWYPPLAISKTDSSSRRWRMCYQSRFGKAEWLKPYTNALLQKLAASGEKHLVVVCPAFSVDCLETLEEMMHDAKHVFLAAGGESYTVVPCLNAVDDHIQMLANMAMDEMNF